MLKSFLFPVLCALTCFVIQALASRSKSKSTEQPDEFRFSVGLRVFVWLGTIAVTVAPFIIVPLGTPGFWKAAVFSGVIGCLMCICCVWGDRFVLKFYEDHFSYGAFKMSNVYYRDIVSAAIEPVGGGRVALIIRTKQKRRVLISGYLSLLGNAERLVKQRMGGD